MIFWNLCVMFCNKKNHSNLDTCSSMGTSTLLGQPDKNNDSLQKTTWPSCIILHVSGWMAIILKGVHR